MNESRPATAREERRYSRRVVHEFHVRHTTSCNSSARYFCWRCLLRTLTGTTRRARRRYVAEMKERAKSIPPSATIRVRRRADGSFERIKPDPSPRAD